MSLDPKDRRAARDANTRRRRRARGGGQAFPDADADASRDRVGENKIRPHAGRPLRREGDATARLSHARDCSHARADASAHSHSASARTRGPGAASGAAFTDRDDEAAALADPRRDRSKSRCGGRSSTVDADCTADFRHAADGHRDGDGVALSRSHGDGAKTVAAAELHSLREALSAAQFHSVHAAAVTHSRDRASHSDAQTRRLLRGRGVPARGHVHADARQEEAVERSRIWRRFESAFAKIFASVRLSRTATGSVSRKSSPSAATRKARDCSPTTSGA